MIGLLQRVSRASVTVNNKIVADIDLGLVVLIGIQRNDGPSEVKRLLERLLTYRVFADEMGRMNLNLAQVNGGLLLVPQFTLAANTRKGARPSFTEAAEPDVGKMLYGEFVDAARSKWHKVESGVFGANMDVSLVNQGPVTFWLEVAPNNS
jgi:D-tyrosyl-tRNA(Tyr) deacylase